MAYRIGDGFDFYAAIADAATGVWDSSASWALSTTTRFANGRSFQGTTNAVYLVKTGFSNEATLFAAVAFDQTTAIGSAGLGHYIQFRDGSTAQCTIVFRGDGSIVLTSGGPTGSVLATYSSAFIANSFDQYQFKVVINNTTGEFHVRKNGSTSGPNTFSATGLNTRGGTANNYANAVALGHSSGTGFSHHFDDFLHWDGSGNAPTDWVGDVRCCTLMPNAAGSSTDFSQADNASSHTFGKTDTQFSRTLVANRVYFTGVFSAPLGGSFSQSTWHLNGTFTGNMKMALYEADGDKQGFLSENLPGRLVAVSDQKVNGVSGDNTITWPSDVGVIGGKSYFFAVMTDANFPIANRNIATQMYTGTTYAGGFPADVSNQTISATDSVGTSDVCYFRAFATITATNFGLANDFRQDGTTTYVFGTNVGDFDEYEVDVLPYSPPSIVGVNVKSRNAKTDAGPKTLRIVGDSGGTAFESADITLTTSFAYSSQFYHQDPDTSAAWTEAAVNALKIGPKVQA